MKSCFDTLHYKSQGALEQDPDNWGSVSLQYFLVYSDFPFKVSSVLRFVFNVMFSDRETARALLEEQAG